MTPGDSGDEANGTTPPARRRRRKRLAVASAATTLIVGAGLAIGGTVTASADETTEEIIRICDSNVFNVTVHYTDSQTGQETTAPVAVADGMSVDCETVSTLPQLSVVPNSAVSFEVDGTTYSMPNDATHDSGYMYVAIGNGASGFEVDPSWRDE